MAKQRYINTHFWDDSFITELTPTEKLLFLYFITNPLTSISGAYEISLKRIAFDTGIDMDSLSKAMDRLSKANKIIYRDGWILVVNFRKNQSSNPKILKGIEESVKDCPQWIQDSLSKPIDRPSHLNSNSNRDSNSNGKVEAYPKKVQTVNPTSEQLLNTWMDGVAAILGEASRFTIADLDKWESVCIKAIDGNKSLDHFLRAVKSELVRCADNPQYFTPNGVLKQMQLSAANTSTGFRNEFTGRGLK